MSVYVPPSPVASRADFLFNRAYDETSSDPRLGPSSFAAAFQQLADSLGQPLMKLRPLVVGELPYKNDYIAMAQESSHDADVIQRSNMVVAQQGVDLYNYAATQGIGLDDKVTALQQQLTTSQQAVRLLIPSFHLGIGPLSAMAGQQAERVLNLLDNADTIDFNNSTGTAYDPASRQVTLKPLNAQNLSAGATVDVGYYDSSNTLLGTPGATTEAIIVPNPNGSSPTIVLGSEGDPHNDPNAMLDTDALTWFEFEKCALISDTQAMVQVGGAWHANGNGTDKKIAEVIDPDTWAITLQDITTSKLGTPPNYELVLTFTCTLKNVCSPSTLRLDPYIAKGSTPARLRQVYLLSSDNTEVKLLSKGERKLDKEIVLPIDTTDIRAVRIEIRQPSPYDTLLGHPYTLVTTQTMNNSTGFMGFGGGADSSMAMQRIATGEDANNLNRTWTTHVGIFGSVTHTHMTQVTATTDGVDTFKGKRWAIGLRSARLERASYTPVGKVSFKPHTFAKPVNAVKVLPTELDVAGTSISYEVSTGDGVWIPLDVGILTALPTASKTVSLRASMTSTIDNRTPTLEAYEIQGAYA